MEEDFVQLDKSLQEMLINDYFRYKICKLAEYIQINKQCKLEFYDYSSSYNIIELIEQSQNTIFRAMRIDQYDYQFSLTVLCNYLYKQRSDLQLEINDIFIFKDDNLLMPISFIIFEMKKRKGYLSLNLQQNQKNIINNGPKLDGKQYTYNSYLQLDYEQQQSDQQNTFIDSQIDQLREYFDPTVANLLQFRVFNINFNDQQYLLMQQYLSQMINLKCLNIRIHNEEEGQRQLDMFGKCLETFQNIQMLEIYIYAQKSQSYEINSLSQGLSSCKSLKCLNLTTKKIVVKDASKLISGIVNLKNLQILKVEINHDEQCQGQIGQLVGEIINGITSLIQISLNLNINAEEFIKMNNVIQNSSELNSITFTDLNSFSIFEGISEQNQGLTNCKQLQILNLQFERGTDLQGQLIKFAKCIQEFKNLKSFTLSAQDATINNEDFELLIEGISKCEQLNIIDLNVQGSYLTDEISSVKLNSLGNLKNLSLFNLSIGNHGLGNIGLKCILNCIITEIPNLTQLICFIRQSQLNDEGLLEIVQVFKKKNKINQLYLTLPQNEIKFLTEQDILNRFYKVSSLVAIYL